MGAIRDTRAELAASLKGVPAKVTEYVPERLAPPAAIVVHGSPLMEAGASFGSRKLRFEVWAVSKLGANARMTDELDDLVDATVDALQSDGWAVENVSQPFPYQANGATFLSATISVSATVAAGNN